MLKIKADKMNDLEKFGFIENDNYPNYVKDLVYNPSYSDTLTVDKNTRIIERTICTISTGAKTCKRVAKSVIEDLIKADMVEKVVEDEQS